MVKNRNWLINRKNKITERWRVESNRKVFIHMYVKRGYPILCLQTQIKRVKPSRTIDTAQESKDKASISTI